MKSQRGSVALAFLLVLVASLLANLWLWHAKGEEHDARVTAESKVDQANAQTKACNDSIGELEKQAKERDAENTALRKEAQNRRRSQESLAQQILSTPAAIPGDDCGSAKKRALDWLKGRKP